jgi:hypothetical protein
VIRVAFFVGAIVVVAIVTTVFAFVAGVGIGFFKEVAVPKPKIERVVYCPIGTTDPDCVESRRRYEAGLIPGPNTPPPRMGSPR